LGAAQVTEIPVDQHVFAFPDDWRAKKFDDDRSFAKSTWTCGVIQSRIDIVAYDGERLYLIELGDFRGRRETLERRLDPNPQNALWKEFCRKLSDSLTILLAAYRSGDENLAPFCKALFAEAGADIDAVLFLDRDSEARPTATRYLSSENLRRRIAKQLAPLKLEVAVVSQITMPPDHPWSVKDAV
jgi:hypothetical protein